MRSILNDLKAWAQWYEPAMARVIVAALFQMLVGVGLTVGNWPDKANAILGFVSLIATLLAGGSIRAAVDSPATVVRKRAEAFNQGVVVGSRPKSAPAAPAEPQEPKAGS